MNVPGPAPTTPATTAPAPAVAARPPLALLPRLLLVIGALLFVLLAWRLLGPHESAAQREADKITRAVIANNMTPVSGDFNAIVRPKLQNRETVGRLSDDLNALGAFKGLKETTPAGAASGYHTFDAQFDKGTWKEDIAFDSDGKVASFHVRAPQ